MQVSLVYTDIIYKCRTKTCYLGKLAPCKLEYTVAYERRFGIYWVKFWRETIIAVHFNFNYLDCLESTMKQPVKGIINLIVHVICSV